MLTYIVNSTEYRLSYKELKELYTKYSTCTDDEFKADIRDILHTACIIAWVKELHIDVLSDEGIIHQLIHLQLNEPALDFSRIREDFNRILRLSD